MGLKRKISDNGSAQKTESKGFPNVGNELEEAISLGVDVREPARGAQAQGVSTRMTS